MIVDRRACLQLAKHRRAVAAAAGTGIGVLVLLAGCGGSDAKPTAARPADRTERSAAGARTTLRQYAAAFTSADGKKVCDLLDPTVAPLKSATKRRCQREVAGLKSRLTTGDAARYRQQFGALNPVVKGNVATLPGNGVVSLRYVDGRWYVRLVPAASSSPTS